ncbi:MAG: PP2C family protein-serine/threonine phosphatase [Trueperaceae bacterium]
MKLTVDLGSKVGSNEARLQEAAKREELLKLERDIQIGREIQQGFLPATLPQPEDWEVVACFHPAREVAGDFYDAFYMAKGRRLGFVVADVCDKGVGAALFMALFRTLVRSNAQQTHSLSWLDSGSGGQEDAEEWLTGSRVRGRSSLPNIGTGALLNAVAGTNDYVIENHMMQGYFVTLFFGVLDPTNGSIVYINGGHNPPIVVRTGGSMEFLKPTGPAVGMMPNVKFEFGQTRLAPGDFLYAFTDGVTDARSPDGAFFGEKRLLETVGRGATSAAELVNEIESRLQAHIDGGVQFDDITMMAIRRSSSPSERI